MRFISVFFLSMGPKYTVKERIMMAICWIPKSTVPATLASVIYNEALASGWTDKQVFGLDIQTTTILSIMVCEPLGAFLID